MSAQAGEHPQNLPKCDGLARIDRREDILSVDAYAHSLNSDPRARHGVDRRFSEAGGIFRIAPRDNVQHDGHVADFASHRPDVVQRLGKRQQAKAAYPPVRGF